MPGRSSQLRASLVAWVLLLGAMRTALSAEDVWTFDIPRIGAVDLARCGDDWSDGGFRIDTFCCQRGVSVAGFTDLPTARLAWDDRGLIVFVRVHDQTPHEASYIRHLFEGDSIEIFVSLGRGSTQRYMLSISPGVSPGFSTPRHCFFLDPSEEGVKDESQLTCEIERRKTVDGYAMEVLLPWQNLQLEATNGVELALQLYIMNTDDGGKVTTAMWEPAGESHLDRNAVFPIRLSLDAAPAFTDEATAQEQSGGTADTIRVLAPISAAGQMYQVESGSRIFRGVLAATGLQASAAIDLPHGTTHRVWISGKEIPVVILPTADLQSTVMQMQCGFDSQVFTGDAFPKPYLKNAGTFRLKDAAYYDADFNQVLKPKSDGRYGGVMRLQAADGHLFNRFITLWRGSHAIADEVRGSSLANRQWWVAFKRKFYHLEECYSQPFVSPTESQSPLAPIVREGSPEQAGINPAVVPPLDAVCREGASATGEPVAICFARHGFVFFSKAYGSLNGQPMSTSTPCDIQSETKTISGALMMMAVDQGLVDLESPIDRYLPVLSNLPIKQPLTVRSLYDHTSGLRGEWGDHEPDTEEIVANFYSSLQVGRYFYNGAGFALGAKILESMSDEALPTFCQEHLLGPLGMNSTVVEEAGQGGISTANDLVKFGQMLLNRGSYGNLRFFSPATFARMLPPAGSSNSRGIGTMLGPSYAAAGVLGHGARNSGMLWIDLKNDMVLIVMSGGDEKRFRGYEPQLFDLLYANLRN